ncbi:MAG: XRE family transcriptional regulator [Lachnospiraceae bacterium]|nr:XRE family transcriptional regulator [Lachnospiraceae bacterium]
MDEKTTSELEAILKNKKVLTQLEAFLDDLDEAQYPDAFRDYFFSLDKVRALSAADLIGKSGIERTYFYQLQRGERQPGRDKILALSIAAHLTLKETQRALEISGCGILYVKNRRDAIIRFCIERKLSMTDSNELLEQFGEELIR